MLYILDGQWDFKLMDSVLGGLVYDKFGEESGSATSELRSDAQGGALCHSEV